MKITVVIPTYNEAQNLPRLAASLFELPLPDLKVLVVDDNSPDGTGRVAEEIAAQWPGRVSVAHREGKLGLGTAYLEGFARALAGGAQVIVQMDADFSHPPEKILDLVAAIEHCDVALGSRYLPGGQLDERWPMWRKGLSYFGNFYARMILGLPVRDVTGGFRAWRRETLAGMPLGRVRSNGYVFQVEMIYLAHQLGYSFQEVPFYFADRRWGESKMSLRIQLEAAWRVWRVRFSYRDLEPSYRQSETLHI